MSGDAKKIILSEPGGNRGEMGCSDLKMVQMGKIWFLLLFSKNFRPGNETGRHEDEGQFEFR